MATGSHLVGRDGVRGELAAAVRDALAGHGGLVLVTGEPGIGKTRLLSEVDGLAAGALVARGSCWDDGAPAFWPWTQVLRECAGGRAAEELLRDWGAGARDALGLVPELADPAEELPPTRFPLFDSVRGVLATLAGLRPLVVLLDDLHWADAGSLRLLRFVAHGLARLPVLVVGAYRDTEGAPDTGRLLEEIAASARVLALPGLDADAVRSLLEATAGAVPDERTVAEVRLRTGGNPLFVRELGRLLAARGAWDSTAVPEGVRAVLRRRLARVSQECHTVLSVASVLGAEFALEPLRACVEPGTGVLELLDEAVAARLVEPSGHGYAFSHALVRDVLYADLPLATRGEWHHRAGQAYERLDPGRLAELARHFVTALPVGDPLVAAGHARRAGRAACAKQAYEVAAGQFRMALDALGGKDLGLRVELLLELGDTLLRTGDIGAARAAFLEAAELARQRGESQELARAALGYGAGLSGFEVRLWDSTQIELLEEALDALGNNDSTLRASTMARLSVALSFVAPTDRRRVLAERAVAMARRLDDPVTLGQALAGHCDVIAGPDDVADRMAETAEIVSLADAAGDRGLELLGRRLRVVALLELGDTLSAYAEMEAFARVAEAFRQPQCSWYIPLWRGLRAYLNGDVEEMARCADEAERIGALADSRNARTLATVARHWVTIETGASASFREVVEAFDELPELAGGNTQSVLDLYPSARDEPTTLAALDNATAILADLPVDSEYLSNLCHAACTAVEHRHAGAAGALYTLLAPHADRFAVDGIGVASHGSVSRWLGALAHVLGRWVDATRHFEDALGANRRAVSPLNVAHTQRQYGAMLAECRPEDAGPVLTAARDAYLAMGLPAWAAVIDAPAPAEGAVFRPDGDVWLLSYAGTAVRLKSSKGLRDIASLLANPGKEIHALDLVGAPSGGDLGPVLDDTARVAYQRRLTELDERISEASTRGDLGALERAEAERDQLVEALASAYGLGGRPRRAGDPAERARGTVTWRIRDALSRIEKAHPALGRHLRNAIRTGTYCVYDPEVTPAWHLTS